MRRFFPLLALLLLLPLCSLAVEGAVYEIFVGSFRDSDGDGAGDLGGVRESLPYIASLGVEGLWLMPISPSPSYHKYDVTDYFAVDPQYGTMESFRDLAEACGERGLRLLVDLVLNHTSSLHPWFLSACESLAVAPCGCENCASSPLCRAHNPFVGFYEFSQGSGRHPAPGAEGWYYEGSFGPHMPDLNLDNALLREEIKKILAHWLLNGADGFRLDACTHYFGTSAAQNAAFLRWVADSARAIRPDAWLVGEAWTDGNAILRLYESGIDSLFDFPFSNTDGYLLRYLNAADGAALAARAAAWQDAVLSVNARAKNAPFLSNHDMGRSAGMLRMDLQKQKMAAAIYLLLPGTPYVYYGEEIGMTGSGKDENKRLPMLWSLRDAAGLCLPPPGADQAQRLKQGVDEQEADPNSLLRFYRQTLAARGRSAALQSGRMTALDTGARQVMAYACESDADSVTILHNLGKSPVSLEVLWEGELAEAWDTGSGLPSLQEDTLTLPPLSGCAFR